MKCKTCSGEARQGRLCCQHCADKQRAATLRWREKNPDKVKGYDAKRQRKPEVRERARLRHLERNKTESFRDWMNAWHLKRKFGITLDQYKSLNKAQEGRCAICGGLNVAGRRLAVDHCHRSGKIRGLLCYKCNVGLGSFDDDLERLLLAALYLEKHRLPSSGR